MSTNRKPLWRISDITRILMVATCCRSGLAKYEGENLSLARVGRAQMGAYLCIASNDVPPTVSKRISLNVNCECGS